MLRSSSALLVALSGCLVAQPEVECVLDSSHRSERMTRSSTLVPVGEGLLWVWCGDADCRAESRSSAGLDVHWQTTLQPPPTGAQAEQPRPVVVAAGAGKAFVAVASRINSRAARFELEALELDNGSLASGRASWELIADDGVNVPAFAAKGDGVVVARDFNSVIEGSDVEYGEVVVFDGSLAPSAARLPYPPGTPLAPVANTGSDSTVLASFDGHGVHRVRFSDPPKPEDFSHAERVMESASGLRRLASSPGGELVVAVTMDGAVITSTGVRLEGPMLDAAVDEEGATAVLATTTPTGVTLWVLPHRARPLRLLSTIDGASAPSVVLTSRRSFFVAIQLGGASHLRHYVCSGLD